MACPVSVGGSLFLVVTGLYSIFFKDRKYRRVWWTGLILLLAGWLGYFFAFDRSAPLRYGLEALSTVFFLVICGRLYHLVVFQGFRPPGTLALARFADRTKPYTMNTGSIMIKTFILSLVILEWVGKAEFGWSWYLWSSVLLLAWWVLIACFRKWGRKLSSKLFPRPSTSRKNDDTDASCPVGFGRD